MDERCIPIPSRTLGVTLFQEQILKVAMEMAGFTGSEADESRRAMAFKRSDERMREVTEKLHARMTERGVSKENQAKVIQAVGSLALYGFPESTPFPLSFWPTQPAI